MNMKLNKYDEYISDMILENIKNDEILLIISDDLFNILKQISHPIARKIINTKGDNYYLYKVTLLDIDDSDKNKKDNISFSLSNKTIEKIISELKLDIKKEDITPGKLEFICNKLYYNKSLKNKAIS